MADPRLLQYLKSYMSQGYSRDQLESHLVSQGWNKKDLDDAFGSLAPKPAMPLAPEVPEKKPGFRFFAKKPAEQKPYAAKAVEKPRLEAREERPRALEEAGIYGREKPSSHFVPVAVLAMVFLIIGAFFYGYFYVINPSFVTKPVLTKPEMPSVGTAISTANVEYMLNELDLYKLHSNPVG